jgi:signal transduction histidine kinase
VKSALLSLAIETERDVVLARQRARQVAGLLGFEAQDQTRIATSVSEIARNACQYARNAKVEFSLASTPVRALVIRVSDRGPGIDELESILDGRYVSKSGMGIGIIGARRLMDHFMVSGNPETGTTVVMTKHLRAGAPVLDSLKIAQIVETLTREGPADVVNELQRQNREILEAMRELEVRYEDLDRLSAELEETNRGVVALYSELDEKAAQLERANHLKTTFLSDFSHEVRTPLNAVRNLTRLLLDGYEGPLGDNQRRAVSLIRSSADGLAQLVDDWLDLARIEAGKAVLRIAEFDLASLFAVLRGVFRPLVASPDVSLVFDEPQEIARLCTDEGKISQILRNLISNALKFTSQGTVTVSAMAGVSDTVVLEVRDTGIGIAREDQGRIFEEFAQVENPIQRGVTGTGLGLPISRKLARLLGGDIAVRSEPGIGSTFVLTVPRVYDMASVDAMQLEAATASAHRG